MKKKNIIIIVSVAVVLAGIITAYFTVPVSMPKQLKNAGSYTGGYSIMKNTGSYTIMKLPNSSFCCLLKHRPDRLWKVI